MKIEIRKVEHDISDLEFPISNSVSFLNDEKNRISLQIEQLTLQFKDIVDRQIQIQKSLSQFECESAANQELSNNLERTIHGIEEKIQSLMIEKRNIEDSAIFERKQHDHIGEVVSELETTCKVEKDEFETMCKEACRLGPRVELKRSPADIDQELTQMVAHLEESRKKKIDPIKLKIDLKEHLQSYEASKIDVTSGEMLFSDLSRALEKRIELMEEFRLHISHTSNIEFIVLLSARGFSGSLDYNHEQKELHLNIQIENSSKVNQTKRDIKQLSGGEKSFGTACFLLSLWESIGSPIRCLDEFDVFMDAVNRRIVLDMLVEYAQSNSFQLILITPIPLNDFLAANPEIHVVRLKDPERSDKQN